MSDNQLIVIGAGHAGTELAVQAREAGWVGPIELVGDCLTTVPTDYKPGDVLIMSLRTPHSGLSNISADRFRMSLDTRIMPSTGKVPMVGVLKAVTPAGLKVEDAAGLHELAFDSKSFVRGYRGDQMPLDEIPDRYKPGHDVIIAFDEGRVLNMRPQN